jgi:alpha-amylase
LTKKADDGKVKTIHDVVKSKQDNLDKLLFYDKYRRASLIDHFLPKDTNIDGLLHGTYQECGDFIGQFYECTTQKKAGQLTTRLSRDGHIRQGNDMLSVRVEKTIMARAGSEELAVTYRLTNTSAATIQSVFASEWNLAITEDAHNNSCFHTPSDKPMKKSLLNRVDYITSTNLIRISDPHIGVNLSLAAAKPMRLWRYPIEAVTNSEDGFELTFQGSCYVVGWDIRIEPRQSWEVNLKWQPADRVG